jgi:hypothetical protein
MFFLGLFSNCLFHFDVVFYLQNQHHGPSIGNKVNSNPLANNSYNMPLGSSGSKSGAVLPAHSDGHSNRKFAFLSPLFFKFLQLTLPVVFSTFGFGEFLNIPPFT